MLLATVNMQNILIVIGNYRKEATTNLVVGTRVTGQQFLHKVIVNMSTEIVLQQVIMLGLQRQ